MLEKFLVCEREFFGNNVRLEFLQIDCSIAETNAICETLNNVLREVYMRTLEHRVRVECMTAVAVYKLEGWALVEWFLFHMRRCMECLVLGGGYLHPAGGAHTRRRQGHCYLFPRRHPPRRDPRAVRRLHRERSTAAQYA